MEPPGEKHDSEDGDNGPRMLKQQVERKTVFNEDSQTRSTVVFFPAASSVRSIGGYITGFRGNKSGF